VFGTLSGIIRYVSASEAELLRDVYSVRQSLPLSHGLARFTYVRLEVRDRIDRRRRIAHPGRPSNGQSACGSLIFLSII
jgi:hypothetical protein